MAMPSQSPLTAFEMERLARIAENRRRLEEMGVLETARDLRNSFKDGKPPIAKRKAPQVKRERGSQPVRRSKRLEGTAAEFGELREDEAVTYSDYEGGLDDILADGADIESMPEEKQEQFQEIRCGSTGRGSVYDSVAGITCHFCRQKKLCGEEGCPRCSRRSTTADCIGKSDCSRCHGATGRFCRACLLIRYGQTLEDARKEMEAGTWLCPHCYEDEHPDEGWMCNSSICMKRRGYKPTGIAIYDAQQRGFPSVAHWLQSQLRKRTSGTTASTNPAAAGSATAGKTTATKAAPTSSSDCSSGTVAVEAPATPLRGSESLAAAAAPAAAAAAGRVTRRGGKAAPASSSEAGDSAAEGGKRACVGETAGSRRSLRLQPKA